MQNGSIFINEKITRTEKFSPYPPNFGTKYYVALNGLRSAWEFLCWAFLLIGLQPIWISSTNMFAFIPLNRHNLPDIFAPPLPIFLTSVSRRKQNTGRPSYIVPAILLIAKHSHTMYIVYSIFYMYTCDTCRHQNNLKCTMSINVRTERKRTNLYIDCFFLLT